MASMEAAGRLSFLALGFVNPGEKPGVVSFGSATGVPPVNGHGQDGRATANDTTTEKPVVVQSAVAPQGFSALRRRGLGFDVTTECSYTAGMRYEWDEAKRRSNIDS